MTDEEKTMLTDLENEDEHTIYSGQFSLAMRNPAYLRKLHDAWKRANAGEDGYMFKARTFAAFHADHQTPETYEITYNGIPIKP